MVASPDIFAVVEVVGLGLVAGLLGGLLGVGGSTVIIPGLTLIFGYNQHLYQAAAMIANVAVSVPAATRHYQSGAVTGPVLRMMLPLALVFVLVGVWLSNREVFHGSAGGLWLGRMLAVFLVYVIVINVGRLLNGRRQLLSDQVSSATDLSQPNTQHAAKPPEPRRSVLAAGVGAAMGLIAGTLGIGGGAVAVPLQQTVLGLPLRSCIANSSVVICIVATMGAVYKNASLASHGYTWQQSLTLALLLAPSCWLGGHFGAGLTHRLPVRQVRLVFVCLMFVAAVKMAALFDT